jgi:hypothetical protein
MRLLIAVSILLTGHVAMAQGLECRTHDVLDWTFEFHSNGFDAQGIYGYEFASSRVNIWDMTDPLTPVLLGTAQLTFGGNGDHPSDAWKENDRLYVSASHQLHIFDITDISNPVEFNPNWNGGRWVEARGTTVYLVDGDFWILDASIPNWIRRFGVYSNESVIEDAVLDGDIAYLAADDGLHVVDISQRRAPTANGIVPGFRLEQITSDGNLIATLDRYGEIIIYDLDAGSSLPVPISTISVSKDASEIELRGLDLFVADAAFGLHVFDLSDPTQPVERALVNLGEYVHGFDLFGDIAVVDHGRYGDALVDLTHIGPRPVLARVPTGGNATSMARLGEHVLVADGDQSLAVFDISDPTNPVIISRMELGRDCQLVAVDGQYVAVSHPDGATLLDYLDPSNPVVLSSIVVPERVAGVAIDGARLGLAHTNLGVFLYDISDRANPIQRTILPSPIGTPGFDLVQFVDSFLYTNHGANGLMVFDITDLGQPVFQTFDSRARNAHDMEYRNGYLYVATTSEGARIYDCSNPADPAILSTYRGLLSENVKYITAEGDRMLVNLNEGLQLIDIADRTNPRYLASTPMISEHGFTLGHRALMWNDRAYAIEEGTLVAIDLSDCAACPADLNEDGAVDFFDLQMYLNLFADGDLRADFNGDTLLDFFDVQAFLNAYSQGCP